jgi:hypothetical protein
MHPHEETRSGLEPFQTGGEWRNRVSDTFIPQVGVPGDSDVKAMPGPRGFPIPGKNPGLGKNGKKMTVGVKLIP